MQFVAGDQAVYDPRGIVETSPVSRAPRLRSLAGKRLAVLDNTKWNGNKLLRGVRDRLVGQIGFSAINYYKKESFSMNASPELIDEIVANNDLVLTAIGD